MPRSLAAGKHRISVMTAKPASMTAPAATELEAGIIGACRILDDDYSLKPATSDRVAERAVCEDAESPSLGPGKFEDGNVTVFRYFDAQGKAEIGVGGDIGDAMFQAMKTKGTELWIGDRWTSKASSAPFAAGDELGMYHVVTDEPIPMPANGFIKWRIPLLIQGDSEPQAVVATGA